jgi:hypothetical protein
MRQNIAQLRRPVGIDPAGRLFPSRLIMKSCPVLPLAETITPIGPNNLDRGGLLYRYLVEAMRAYVPQRGRHHAG